jgi:predicted N-acyltransferase
LIGADTVLPVRWSALEEYVAWLKQSRRAKVRRDRRRFASYPGEVAVERLGDCIEQAAPLLAELQQRYGLVDTADDMRRYLARQAAELDDRSVVFAWRAEGRLLGFALFFELDGVLYARSVGFDAPYVGSGAYFSVAFYEPLRYAIERGLRELRFGGGTYEAKLLRGACPVPLWSLVVPPADELHRWRELLADWNEDALEWWQHSAGPIVGPLPRETWLQPVEQAAVASAGERTPLGGAAQP